MNFQFTLRKINQEQEDKISISNDYNIHHSSSATSYSRKNKNVKDLNHDSLGKSLKPLPQSGNNRHLENRHKEDEDILKSPHIPNDHRNIESPFNPFRKNSFDTQIKANLEGISYRNLMNISCSK